MRIARFPSRSRAIGSLRYARPAVIRCTRNTPAWITTSGNGRSLNRRSPTGCSGIVAGSVLHRPIEELLDSRPCVAQDDIQTEEVNLARIDLRLAALATLDETAQTPQSICTADVPTI